MGERKSNIEILRCLSIIFVIILHFNAESVGGAFQYVEEGTFNYYFLYIMESLSISAVNIFVLISGYFYYGRFSRKLGKPLMLIFTCICYKILIYFVTIICGIQKFTFRGILENLIPNNYFIVLYIAIYFISLYLNVILDKLSHKEYKTMLVVSTILFVGWDNIWSIVADVFDTNIVGISFVGAWGSQSGYTVVNFCLLYAYGAYIRKYIDSFKRKRCHYGIGYIIISIFIFVESMFIDVVWDYNNFLVILQGCCLFLFFLKCNIRTNQKINKVSSTVFGVFLLQSFLYTFLDIQTKVNGEWWGMTIYFFTTVISIFTLSSILVLLINIILEKIETRLQKTVLFQYEIGINKLV